MRSAFQVRVGQCAVPMRSAQRLSGASGAVRSVRVRSSNAQCAVRNGLLDHYCAGPILYWYFILAVEFPPIVRARVSPWHCNPAATQQRCELGGIGRTVCRILAQAAHDDLLEITRTRLRSFQ